MDSRIDLTEHRDFADRNPYGSISTFYGRKIPWDVDVLFPESKYENLQELVLTGTKNEIEIKKMATDYETGNFCERCGLDFSSRPWRRSKNAPCLCAECDEQLKSEVHSYEGLNMSKEPIKSSDILTFRFAQGDFF